MRAHVGDVREPCAVRPVRREVSLDQVGSRVRLRRGRFGRALRPPGAAARRAGPAVLAHGARDALARGPLAGPLELGEDLRRPVASPARPVYLGDLRRELGIAQVVRAGRPLPPRAAALAGDLQRGAHLGHAPGALVEKDERELGPLRPGPYSRLLAKKALASKSIPFSLLSRSFSRPRRLRSSAIWNGLSSGGACAASALLTQSGRLPGSTPSSRAVSAWVPPRSLYSLTACCLNSAVYFGDGFPIPASLPRLRHHAETEVRVSTGMGQIHIGCNRMHCRRFSANLNFILKVCVDGV